MNPGRGEQAQPATPDPEAALARRRVLLAFWTAVAGIALNLWVRVSAGIPDDALPRAGVGRVLFDIVALRNGAHLHLPFMSPGVLVFPALVIVAASALALRAGSVAGGIVLFVYYVVERSFLFPWVLVGQGTVRFLLLWAILSVAYAIVFFLGIQGAVTLRRLKLRRLQAGRNPG